MNLPIFVYWNVMFLWYFVTEVNVGLDLVWYFVVSTQWNIEQICRPFHIPEAGKRYPFRVEPL